MKKAWFNSVIVVAKQVYLINFAYIGSDNTKYTYKLNLMSNSSVPIYVVHIENDSESSEAFTKTNHGKHCRSSPKSYQVTSNEQRAKLVQMMRGSKMTIREV